MSYKLPANLTGLARFDSMLGLHLIEAGVGLPLVLIHGLGDEGDSFRHVVDALTGAWRVVAPDLPGFGRSPLPAKPGLAALESALGALLARLGPSVLVGSSLGAALAGRAARRHGALGLVLVDGLPDLHPNLPEAMAVMAAPGAGEARFALLRAGGPDAAFASLEPFYAQLNALPTEDQAFLRERVWERVNNPAHEAAFLAVLRDLASGREGGADGPFLGIPSLTIWGSDDHLTPAPKTSDFLERPMVVIEGAGHLPFQERPHEFLAALSPFLERL